MRRPGSAIRSREPRPQSPEPGGAFQYRGAGPGRSAPCLPIRCRKARKWRLESYRGGRLSGFCPSRTKSDARSRRASKASPLPHSMSHSPTSASRAASCTGSSRSARRSAVSRRRTSGPPVAASAPTGPGSGLLPGLPRALPPTSPPSTPAPSPSAWFAPPSDSPPLGSPPPPGVAARTPAVSTGRTPGATIRSQAPSSHASSAPSTARASSALRLRSSRTSAATRL